MGIFDSLFSFNVQKMFISGKIDKVYSNIYNVAEGLAVHETNLYRNLLEHKLRKKAQITQEDNTLEYFDKVVKYRQERLQHHINEMKDLLKLREDVLKEKTEKGSKK